MLTRPANFVAPARIRQARDSKLATSEIQIGYRGQSRLSPVFATGWRHTCISETKG